VAWDQIDYVNLYRSPKDRYYRRWMPKLLVLIIVVGGIIALLTQTPVLSKIEGAHDKSSQQTVSHVKPPTQSDIPTVTTVKPPNGATIAPVVSGPTTLTTTISVSCPAAVSLSAIGNSNALNTLTVTGPTGASAKSTGSQPEVTTYSSRAGIWNLTDVSEGTAANIDWSANGTNCIQG
jgi:cytoskeletal protein RodZ